MRGYISWHYGYIVTHCGVHSMDLEEFDRELCDLLNKHRISTFAICVLNEDTISTMGFVDVGVTIVDSHDRIDDEDRTRAMREIKEVFVGLLEESRILSRDRIGSGENN